MAVLTPRDQNLLPDTWTDSDCSPGLNIYDCRAGVKQLVGGFVSREFRLSRATPYKTIGYKFPANLALGKIPGRGGGTLRQGPVLDLSVDAASDAFVPVEHE